MALQSSGAISLANVQTEFGGSAPISLSEYYGRVSGIPASGTISLANFYGKSSVSQAQIKFGNSPVFWGHAHNSDAYMRDNWYPSDFKAPYNDRTFNLTLGALTWADTGTATSQLRHYNGDRGGPGIDAQLTLDGSGNILVTMWGCEVPNYYTYPVNGSKNLPRALIYQQWITYSGQKISSGNYEGGINAG